MSIKKIASVWSPKGGSGKTSVTLNMAYYLSMGDRKVTVYDYDEQGSTTKFFNNSTTMNFNLIGGEPGEDNLPTADTEYIVIDYPPRHDILPMGNIIVVPCGSSPSDYDAVKDGLRQLLKHGIEGKRFIFVPFGVSQNKLSSKLIEDSFIELCEIIPGAVVAVRTSEPAKMLWQKGVTVFQNSNKVMDGIRQDYVKLTKTVFGIRK